MCCVDVSVRMRVRSRHAMCVCTTNQLVFTITQEESWLLMATTLPLKNPHFDHVRSKKKNVDARILFPSYSKIKVGCTLKFVLGQNFILRRVVAKKIYSCFRDLLLGEGVKSCLPDLEDGDVDAGVKIYHRLRCKGESYEVLARRFKVVAWRLDDVQFRPYRPFTRTEKTALAKLLKPMTRTQWLTKIGQGTFAHVYKFKRCVEVLGVMQMSGNQRLKWTLENTAVRILKTSLSKTVRNLELKSTERAINKLSWHPNILREQKLCAGISSSQLYSETLRSFIKSKCPSYPSRRFSCEHVLSALASAVTHMHKHNMGHFDIKPANVLIKWYVRGQFKGSQVVLSDFGLTREFRENGELRVANECCELRILRAASCALRIVASCECCECCELLRAASVVSVVSVVNCCEPDRYHY